jgi:DNA modification methylase
MKRDERTGTNAPRRIDPNAQRGRRRSLSHVGGEVFRSGDAELSLRLAEALDVPTSEQSEIEARAHVHGFHAYPARMHPTTARRAIEALSSPGDRVLDPFCGSGTVAVEARLARRLALGVDANPLAVRLAELKVRGTNESHRAAIVAGASRAAAVADDRRKKRTGASHRFGEEDVALFDPHVLLELDGLRLGIDSIASDSVRSDVELVFSAILTKVSRRAGDTSDRSETRRIAAGYPARLFVKKADELGHRLAEIADALVSSPRPIVREGDARELEGVLTASVDLVVTSPPYPGVYDYVAHHAARLRWLRLSQAEFDRREVGARRHLDLLGQDRGRAQWATELSAVLDSLSRVTKVGGRAVLLIADSVVAGRAIFADDLLRSVAPRYRFAFTAVASQERPHFHAATMRAFAARPRREHAILLVRT